MKKAAILLALVLCAVPFKPAGADISDFAFAPHPGAHLPLATELVDEYGRRVELGTFFGQRPVVLVLEYLRCRSLCGVTLDGIITALKAMPLKPGRDFDLLAVSIDPRDTPAEAIQAKSKYEAKYTRRDVLGFHFLTGKEAAVRKIAAQIGFPYRFEAKLGTYIHPAGFVIATPQGDVSSYLEGVGVEPARLVQALADAQQLRRIGPLARILLFCHVEGAPIGRLTVPVLTAFMIANAAAGFALILVFTIIRRRRHG